MNKQKRLQHLYQRAGFGLGIVELKNNLEMNEKAIRDQLFQDSVKIIPLQATYREIPTMSELNKMSESEKKELQQMNRKDLGLLNAAWINEMVSSKAQLREKMSLFWHGHFATRHNGIFLAQKQINTIRTYALGNFGDLLHAISKDPAMLRFLNNQQNRKAHPNENFAREVLELFTLGRNHYSEKDIQEAARAFTGWSSRPNGEFIFRRRLHDEGQKTFLGKTGNFGGEDILQIILEQRQTARFITQKLYRYFVNEEVNEEIVENWAQFFYESGYDIQALMQRIFSSDHFYQVQNIGTRIKSPIEYLVGMMRLLNMTFDTHEGPILLQRILGQILLQPPNVAGWPGGKAWIDSSSMMSRLRIPQNLIFATDVKIRSKASFAGNEDAINMGRNNKFQQRLAAKINWQPILEETMSLNEAEILRQLADYFLQIMPQNFDKNFQKGFIPSNDREEMIKWISMRLLCTPEFQMC